MLLDYWKNEDDARPAPSGRWVLVLLALLLGGVLGVMGARSLAGNGSPPSQAPVVFLQSPTDDVPFVGVDAVHLLSTMPFPPGSACEGFDEVRNSLEPQLVALQPSVQQNLIFFVAAGHDKTRLRPSRFESNIALAQARSSCVAAHISAHPICGSATCTVLSFVRSASDPTSNGGNVEDLDRAAHVLVLVREKPPT